jgi:hypothetical protein
MQEDTHSFRVRKFCGPVCHHPDRVERQAAASHDPVVSARLVRGIRLNVATDEHVQRARKMMQENWQNPAFLPATKRRPRRFTPEQIRAIRADPRVALIVCREYGVTHQTITSIRARTIYGDVD